MLKVLILLLLCLGLATMYQAQTNRGRVLNFSTAGNDCTVKVAMKAVRLGRWGVFTLLLNAFLILSILIFNS